MYGAALMLSRNRPEDQKPNCWKMIGTRVPCSRAIRSARSGSGPSDTMTCSTFG